jgi:hypothetical protein
MAGLFPKTKMPPPPKPVRMPTEEDPEIERAVERGRAGRYGRGGGLGTRLTTNTQGIGNIDRTVIGSSGARLGS